jgi:hypothetical protein
MYAGRNRKSAMRRKVPLTKRASGSCPVGIGDTGIRPAAAVLRYPSTSMALPIPPLAAHAAMAEGGVSVERPERSEDERR